MSGRQRTTEKGPSGTLLVGEEPKVGLEVLPQDEWPPRGGPETAKPRKKAWGAEVAGPPSLRGAETARPPRGEWELGMRQANPSSRELLGGDVSPDARQGQRKRSRQVVLLNRDLTPLFQGAAKVPPELGPEVASPSSGALRLPDELL